MLKMSQSFVIRMVLWSALVIYMICDFFLFRGPLRNELKEIFKSPEEQAQHDMSQGICAKVWNGPIYLSQVDRRVSERLWRTGRDPQKISEQEQKILRWAALTELIDEAVLRIKVRANRSDFPISEEAIDAEVLRFTQKFSSAEELEKALKSQGLSGSQELRYQLAARLQQKKCVESKIASAIDITEEQAQEWYNEHEDELKMPERRRVRHVFLATLDHPSHEAQSALEGHLERLKNNEINFAQLAAEVSEDLSSKAQGGDLNWMRKDRLPQDFGEAVFALPLNRPSLIQTKLGWHIVELTDVKAPELLTFEKMKVEIMTALKDSRRAAAVKQYRRQLRIFSNDQILIYKEMLK